jgi:hypothetical protein
MHALPTLSFWYVCVVECMCMCVDMSSYVGLKSGGMCGMPDLRARALIYIYIFARFYVCSYM